MAERKRRVKGEGSIIQLSDGSWRSYMTLGYDPKGEPQRKYFYGRTQREVRDKLADARQNQRKGLPIVPERQTVGQFLDQWLETSARQRLRPNTFESYKDLIRLHIAPELGRKTLVKLTPQDVQALLSKKQAPRKGKDKDGKDITIPGLSPRAVQYPCFAQLRHGAHKAG